MAAPPSFCPRCGTRLLSRFDGGRDRPACPDAVCGFIDFGSFSIGAAGVVIREGRALLVQRGWDPGKGSWQIPGGYVEHDEQIIPAVEREVMEEAGIEAKVRDVIGFRHALGGSVGGASTNIYVVFRLDELGSAEPRFDNDEVTGAAFYALDELANMERVQNLSLWAIQRALTARADVGLHPDFNSLPMGRGGWSLFGVPELDGLR